MNYNLYFFQKITVDLDTRSLKTLNHAKRMLKKFGVENILVEKSKRGYHIFGTIFATYWEACCIRLMAGDDLKRLKLDIDPNKAPKNVFFTKKTREELKW